MPAEKEYRGETQALPREEIDRSTGRILLEFGTPGCGICRALTPRVAMLLDRYLEVRHIKVEDEPSRRLGRSFDLRLWPNLVCLRDGRIVRKLARPRYISWTRPSGPC